ncbi:MAG: periplasmic heavy metal sensor [Candidatus Tritonobacter lacicola]|nr:periplasmic heavy metal sensor [Candidatus Tritonobacter lacicola]
MKARFGGTIATLSIGALLLMLAPASAGPSCHGKGKPPEHMEKSFDESLRELNLADEQMEQIKTLHEEKISAMKKHRDSIKEKHKELREELDREVTDMDALDNIVSELKIIEAQRIDGKVGYILKMKETLNPEQFQKLHSLHKEHWKKGERGRRGRRGKGHWRGQTDDQEQEMEGSAPPSKKHRGAHFDECLQELNLTDEQMEQIKAQLEEKSKAKKEDRDSIRAKHEELREELDRETTDSEKLASIVSELKSLEARCIDGKVGYLLKMKETLTPGQFQKLHAPHGKRWRGERGRRGGKGHWRCGSSDQPRGSELPPDQQQEPSTGTGEGTGK